MTEADAKKLVARRFRARCEDYLTSLEEHHQWALEGEEYHPSEAVLLAYLMTAVDGYNEVEYHAGSWESRPRKGFGTVLGYNISLGKAVANFLLESRSGPHSRELAVVVDATKPNIRTTEKRRNEEALAATCSAVMSFSPDEILADPEGCAVRIENRLNDLIEEAMQENGILVRPSPT